MISVIIHWDHKKQMDANNKRFIFQLWDYVARSFGVPIKNTIFVDLEGSLAGLSPPNPVVNTLEEALSIAKKDDLIPVYVHDSSETSLSDFEHPEKAVYVFGPNYDSIKVPEDAVSVRIPLYAEPMDLFSQTVLPIILYHRLMR